MNEKYSVTVYFDGLIEYEIEAGSETEAKEKAEEMFNGEDAKVVKSEVLTLAIANCSKKRGDCMDKIVLGQKDIEFTLRWRDEHKDLVRLGVAPMKAVKIICVDSGFTITGIRNERELRLTVNKDGRGIGNLSFELLENGLCKLVRDTTKLSQENRQAVLTVYCSVMALIVFGKLTVDTSKNTARKNESRPKKSTKSHKRSKRNGVTYILTTTGNELQMMAKGSHRRPQGSFSVRGHYRHYKSGKVVWIAEYTKGCGRKKDKTYKVGVKGSNYEQKL